MKKKLEDQPITVDASDIFGQRQDTTQLGFLAPGDAGDLISENEGFAKRQKKRVEFSKDVKFAKKEQRNFILETEPDGNKDSEE